MKFKTVSFSQEAKDLINMMAILNGATQGDAARDMTIIGKRIAEIPREKGLDVDTSDDCVTYYGKPLSFIRNWKDGTIMVLTVEEAKALDKMG